MENDGEITVVHHDGKITGGDINNESISSGITGATDKADEMALVKEAIEEAERYIAEGTDLLAGIETETEDTRKENVIHTDLQVSTVEHTYNLRRRRNPWPEYTK